MKTNKLIFGGCTLSLSLLMAGCGGNTASTVTDDTTTKKTTYSVSGSVPGTLIEAFCKDGGYYSVNSTNNGTTNHPFKMTLPSDVSCKFIMTTNEKDPDISKRIVTPLFLSDGSTTSSYFQLTGDTDLGYIELPMSGTGIQTPLIIEVADARVKVNKFEYDPLDIDNDGIPNVYEDDDQDGLYNKFDDDDDNDGIKDIYDDDHKNDYDGDGIENRYDEDDDNDRIKDIDDDDDDNDGIKDKDENNDNSQSANIALPTSYVVNAGRLLGSQCAQCHGTNGVSVNKWDSIAGEDKLHEEMFEDDEPIMSAQARGYTNEEISLIESWLKTLTKYKD